MTTPTVTAAKEAPRASSRCTVPAVTTCPRKSPAQTNSAGGQKAQGKQTGKAACSAGGGGNAGRGKEGVREASEWHQANSSGTSEQLQTSSRQDTALQWLHALTELSSCPAQSRMERPGGAGCLPFLYHLLLHSPPGPRCRVPGSSLPGAERRAPAKQAAAACRGMRRGNDCRCQGGTQAECLQSQALLPATEAAGEGSSCFQRPLQSGNCFSASTGLHLTMQINQEMKLK